MNFLKGLYTQNDFGKLTAEDLLYLKDKMQLDVKDEDVKEYLFRHIELYEGNETYRSMISSKVLAGKIPIKWMHFFYAGDFTKEALVSRLESQRLGYNAKTIDRWQNLEEDGIVCIQKNGTYYTVRIVIYSGWNKINDGLTTRREPAKKTVIANIDAENNWLELRCSALLADKALRVLKKELKLDNCFATPLTNKYSTIEEFKESLTNGFRFSNKSIPDLDIELTENDKKELVELFNLMDGYIENRDGDALIRGLETLDLDFERTPIIQIILANIGKVSLDVHPDSKDDMGKSLIYMLMKDYATDAGAYIRFSIVDGGPVHTMRISLKENSVYFSTSATEEVIEYVRSKIV